jgi:O-antigen ligase
MRAARSSAGHYALLVTLALATALVTAVGGSAFLPVLPVVLVTGFYVVTRVPLRWSALGLVLLLLIPDDTVEAATGQWRTPFALVGDVVHFRLDSVLKLPGLAVTGMEILLALLFGVWAYRRSTMSRVDGLDRPRPATAISVFLLIYLAGVLYSELFGLARGLPLVPWKLRNLLHAPLLATLFLLAFRDTRDHLLLGRFIVVSACVRAVIAIIVQRVAIAETGGRFAFATSHGDSLLFAMALFLLVIDLLLRPDRSRLVRFWLLVPLIVIGGIENQRRIFWVMLFMTLASAYLLSPMKHWKVVATRVLLVTLPVIVLYVGVGWNAGAAVFAPVQTLRSVVDTSTNRSSYWREVENWNIAVSMRELPITGLGLGGSYTEIMANDSMTDEYKEYREWPHNSYLGLLLLLGLGGFTAVFALPAVVVFLSVRSYRMADTPELKLVALACLGGVIACLVLAWGDLGMRFPQYKVLMALAVATSAHLSVATGAWPSRRRPAAGART